MQKLKMKELGRKSVEEFQKVNKIPVIIVLDNVRSAYNTGSVFRTADAFLVEGIYLTGITGKPPHREILKTALGATESVRWKYFKDIDDAIKELKEKEYQIVAIEQAKGSIFLHEYPVEKEKKYALVFGNEVKGVSETVMQSADAAVEIPQFGTKHSFNISVSAGIVLWEFFKKLRL